MTLPELRKRVSVINKYEKELTLLIAAKNAVRRVRNEPSLNRTQEDYVITEKYIQNIEKRIRFLEDELDSLLTKIVI